MKIPNLFVTAALTMGGFHLYAQELGVEYTAELQSNFSDCNFVNLLRLNGEMALSKSLTLEASTISIAKTRKERIIDDLQNFSNIEEENLPLALAVCGANWQVGDSHSIFIGVRNMNEDYFTSPTTSFFNNSSCGIFPTISSNYSIANYPLASVGLHYRYEHGSPSAKNGGHTETFTLQASLYNGTGYNRFTGRDNIFRFCPKSDGVFAIAEAQCQQNENLYFLGTSLYCNDGISVTPWAYSEFHATKQFTFLAGLSHAFGSNIICKDFFGFGAHFRRGKTEIGIFTDYAKFADTAEWATELTCKYQANNRISIQPTTHFITTAGEIYCVLTLRLKAEL